MTYLRNRQNLRNKRQIRSKLLQDFLSDQPLLILIQMLLQLLSITQQPRWQRRIRSHPHLRVRLGLLVFETALWSGLGETCGKGIGADTAPWVGLGAAFELKDGG